MCYVTDNKQVNLKQPLRISNHRKDVNEQNLLQADHQADEQFRLPSQNFNKLPKFILFKQLNDSNIDKELLKYRLKNVKTLDYKPKKLQPHGFIVELNCSNP